MSAVTARLAEHVKVVRIVGHQAVDGKVPGDGGGGGVDVQIILEQRVAVVVRRLRRTDPVGHELRRVGAGGGAGSAVLVHRNVEAYGSRRFTVDQFQAFQTEGTGRLSLCHQSVPIIAAVAHDSGAGICLGGTGRGVGLRRHLAVAVDVQVDDILLNHINIEGAGELKPVE